MVGLFLRYDLVLFGLLLANKSFAAYTAISYFPDNAIYQIDESYNAEKILDPEDGTYLYSITNDPISGNTYVISGDANGNQSINRLCEGELHDNIPISPSSINLYCLTSGPSGVYAVETRDLSIGKLDTDTGEWTYVAPLKPPNATFPYVVAQNSDGVIYHINNNGKAFTNRGSASYMQVVSEPKFPPGYSNYCGEFEDDRNIIATTDNGDRGGIVHYKFNKEKIKLVPLVNEELFLLDITITDDEDLSSSGTCDLSDPTTAPTKTSKKSSKKTSKKKKSKTKTNVKSMDIALNQDGYGMEDIEEVVIPIAITHDRKDYDWLM